MPVSSVERHLGSQWRVVLDRAAEHQSSIPTHGLPGADYAAAVLFDVDPALTDELLTLFHNRRLAWIRRSRGSVRVYSRRPETIAIPKDAVAIASTLLCEAIAGHMLALARAEVASIEAFDAGEREVSWRRSDDAQVHCARVITIVRSHTGRGLPLADIRACLHQTFAAPAVAALIRYEPRLARGATAQAIAEPQRVQKRQRLPSNLSLKGKIYQHIASTGQEGATRTRLMEKIRPKPSSDELDQTVAPLLAEGRIVAREVKPSGRGRPGLRYFATEVGLPHVASDGLAVIPAP